MKKYYNILGIPEDSTIDEIRVRYKELVRKYHPDVNSDSDTQELFKEVNEAYKILTDEKKRTEYDQGLDETKKGKESNKNHHEENKQEEKPVVNSFLSAITRLLITAFIGLLIGAVLGFVLWFLSKDKSFNIAILYPVMFWGGLIGALMGADFNFDLEGYLGETLQGKAYGLIRVFLYAISFSYFGGRIFLYLQNISVFKKVAFLPFSGILVGLIIGAIIGSDTDWSTKLHDEDDRFKLGINALKIIGSGLIGLTMGLIYGNIIQVLTSVYNVFWLAFIGFSLGIIAGSVNSKIKQ